MLGIEIPNPKPNIPTADHKETENEFRRTEVGIESREITAVTKELAIGGVDTFHRARTRRRLCRSSNIF
jgi:hypothetical protein